MITPLSTTIPSPLEMMMQRKTRTKLPQLLSNIRKTAHNVYNMCDELTKHQSNPTEVGYLVPEPGTPVYVLSHSRCEILAVLI